MQNVGGESILVPIGAKVMDMNGVIILNDTGAYMWELLEQERMTNELTAVVAERFAVAPERIRADVQFFLDEIARLGMLDA